MTQHYGLMGHPIDASPSPAMHNAAFKELGIDATYELFLAQNFPDALELLDKKEWSGFNVTTPFKTLMANELENLVDHAARAKAVNTVWKENNKIYGTLTDVDGILIPLQQQHAADGEALILGAGGAARAAVLALEKLDCTIHIAARKPEQAQEILDALKPNKTGKALALKNVDTLFNNVNILIQSTPVGRNFEQHDLPWDKATKNLIAFEMLYTPKETPFLKSANSVNARCIEGWQMLLHQGMKAFEIWTKQTAPQQVMQQAILDHLSRQLLKQPI